ncbi:hypothetical protein ACFPM0_16580 [Pseudonocardia sulfidoxydans]|uniref:hypothetical protein n=1 Tax=Pseudonocardia sulfidoxydans TaxID=54011 RepID=UPI00360D33B9
MSGDSRHSDYRRSQAAQPPSRGAAAQPPTRGAAAAQALTGGAGAAPGRRA